MVKASKLSRRERQIMDVLYRLDEASAREVMESLEDSLNYSSVRTFLRKLEEKGHIKHRESGKKYLYSPVVGREKASTTALSNLVKTFFSDSPVMAVNSLLDMSLDDISDEEIKELEKLIENKKKSLPGR